MENSEVVEVGALTRSNAVLRSGPPSETVSGHPHYRSDARPSALSFKVLAPAQISAGYRSKRETANSDDETRLLGVAKPQIDPDAVLITRPSAKKHDTYKGPQPIPSGFRPRNTLKDPTEHEGQIRGHHVGLQSSRGRKRSQLDLEIMVGDNVTSTSQHFQTYVSPVGEQQAKRQKLGSQSNPQNHSDPLSSNDSDICFTAQAETKSQQPRRQVQKDFSQTSALDGKEGGGFKIDEYIKLERRMDSTLRTRIKAKPRTPINTESSVCTSPDATVTQAPVRNVLQNANRPSIGRSTYKGTARIDSSIPLETGSAANGTSQYDTGGKSRYFPSSNRLTDNTSRGKLDPEHGTQGRHDKRRTSDEKYLSSDELESGTTVGDHATVNLALSNKISRPNSPAKAMTSTVNVMLSRDGLGGLAPSTIPRTKWTGRHRGQRGITSSSLSDDLMMQEKESWGIDLDTISTNQIMIKGPGLGLDFNSENQVYYVKFQGKKQDSSLQIDPKKLRRAILAKGHRKLRFELVSSQKIDIEMSNDEGVSTLLEQIESTLPLAVEWKTSDWMDKAFNKRIAEASSHPKTPRSVDEDEPLDIQLAKSNKQRRDDAQKTVERNNEYASKRQRTRLLDGMRVDDRSIARFQARMGSEDTNDQIDNSSLDISRFSQRIHQGLPNPHLSGSRVQPDRLSKQKKPLSTVEETLKEVTRHKPTDLGTPWRKPLLFPKNGKKKASVEFSDLERLEETEFLNDNLIGFYLRYLEQRLEETKPEIAKKKGKKGINYEAVQKWTRSVDIFGFDYVVVPINESAHWYLAIICNLPALLPGYSAAKGSAENKDACSSHHDQPAEDTSIAATAPADQPSSPIIDFTLLPSDQVSPDEGPNLEDQAPTASFAEMSLEGDEIQKSSIAKNCITRDGADNPEQGVQEQGMLDAQIDNDLAQSTAQTLERVPLPNKDAELMENEENTMTFRDQNVHASAKKRKRKSAPPITRINPDSPAIITFDSLGLPHAPTIRILKDYLLDEGRAKRGLEWEELSIQGVNAKDIPLQDNFCDCGLFLLGYVDKFLDDPKEFTSKILAREYDIDRDWPRLSPSMLRVSIRKQIMELHKDQQDDRKESTCKTDERHDKEHEMNERRYAKDNVAVQMKQEEPQSPHLTSPRLPKTPIIESNPRRGMTKKEALASALEIGAPEPEKLIVLSSNEHKENDTSSPKDSPVDRIKKELLDYDLDNELNDNGAKVVRGSDEGIHKRGVGHQSDTSSSAGSKGMSEPVQIPVKKPEVIEDSQPDSVQVLPSQDPSSSLPLRLVRKADDSIEQARGRSPSTVRERDNPSARGRRPRRSSKPRKERESSIIELD